MTAITNKLQIKYKPWKIYGSKNGQKTVWAETTETSANKRQETLEKDGWSQVRIITGKEAES